MRINSLTVRFLVLLMTLVFIDLGVSAYAGNPGSTGNQSVGSIGISLRISSSIRARQVDVSKLNPPQSSGSTQKYLCLDMNETQRVSLYVMAYNADGSQMKPVSHWSSDGQQAGYYRNQLTNCRVTVPLDLPTTYQSNDGPITLIISPE